MKNLGSLSNESLIDLLKEQIKLTAEQAETIKELVGQIQQLQTRLDHALHLLYGTKNEKRKKTEPTPENKPSDSQIQVNKPKQAAHGNNNGRGTLSEHLPRIKIKHDLPEDKRFCRDCHIKIYPMGKVITEQLGFKPAEFFVKQHVRYKYKCNHCGDITTAPLPPQPIDKGLADAGVLAEILINKHQDCLPLYRQQQRFARHGIQLPLSTLCDWIAQGANLLKPIVDFMKQDAILPGKRIFTDDTPYPVQDKSKKGQTHMGRLWTYVGGGQKSPICVVYEYTKSRSKSAPKKFLEGFRGYLQADAYPGYDSLYQSGDMIEVACWAHARRHFTDIVKLAKEPGKADKALDFIGELYHIEELIKDLSPKQIKAYRRRYSKPILKQFRRWLKRIEPKLLPKTPIGKAIAYLKNHWLALNNYLRDGTLSIDNNAAERSIRMIVIGRKNYLFAGSHEAAQNAAIVYSIIETCKMNGMNTFDYLNDVLTRLPTTLNKDLHHLAPYNWLKMASE